MAIKKKATRLKIISQKKKYFEDLVKNSNNQLHCFHLLLYYNSFIHNRDKNSALERNVEQLGSDTFWCAKAKFELRIYYLHSPETKVSRHKRFSVDSA